MSDEYSCVDKKKLRLRNDDNVIQKKKKSKPKKSKDKNKNQLESCGVEKPQQQHQHQQRFTKAELAFKQQQEAMRNKRILEKASTTHKQRVEKFNEHLDTLTEHFDIPKVSWTK